MCAPSPIDCARELNPRITSSMARRMRQRRLCFSHGYRAAIEYHGVLVHSSDEEQEIPFDNVMWQLDTSPSFFPCGESLCSSHDSTSEFTLDTSAFIRSLQELVPATPQVDFTHLPANCIDNVLGCLTHQSTTVHTSRDAIHVVELLPHSLAELCKEGHQHYWAFMAKQHQQHQQDELQQRQIGNDMLFVFCFKTLMQTNEPLDDEPGPPAPFVWIDNTDPELDPLIAWQSSVLAHHEHQLAAHWTVFSETFWLQHASQRLSWSKTVYLALMTQIFDVLSRGEHGDILFLIAELLNSCTASKNESDVQNLGILIHELTHWAWLSVVNIPWLYPSLQVFRLLWRTRTPIRIRHCDNLFFEKHLRDLLQEQSSKLGH